MRVGILLAPALAAGLAAHAQNTNLAPHTRSLSLRECLDLALSRNLDLQIEHLTTDIVGFNLSGSYGVYTPTLSFRAQHDYVNHPGDFDPQKFNPDFPYEMQNDTLMPGLTGQLPIGLTYGFKAYTREDNARTDFRSDPADALVFPGGIRATNNYFSEARVTLQQHLLKDFWIDADREQIMLRRHDVKISQQAMRFEVMRIVLAVELAYYDVVAAREAVHVQEQAMQLREQLVAETRRRVEVGDLPPLDAEQAETQLQNSLTSVTAAREALVTRQNLLKALLTDDFASWADTDLVATDPLLAMPQDLDRSRSFVEAMQARPDLAEARLAVEKSDVVVRFRKNQLFPSLDLVGSYGGLGVADTAHSSINNTVSFDNEQYSYGAVLIVPLYNLTERNAYRASKAERQIARLQLKKAEQGVLLEIADDVNRAQSRWAQVGSTQKARGYAEGALAAEQKKLQNGLSTAFIVLQLQETLTLARMAELQAKADYNKVVAQLAFAQGSILEKHHLNLEVK
jgi:outer membrane protein TolC